MSSFIFDTSANIVAIETYCPIGGYFICPAAFITALFYFPAEAYVATKSFMSGECYKE